MGVSEERLSRQSRVQPSQMKLHSWEETLVSGTVAFASITPKEKELQRKKRTPWRVKDF